MSKATPLVEPGLCVGVGAIALCCGAPGLVGALVASGGIAAGDAALTAAGAVLIALGLAYWRVTRRAKHPTPPVPETTRRRGSG